MAKGRIWGTILLSPYETLLFVISFEHVCCFSWLPQKVTFDAGPQLQFLFHSDSSNNEWGYKFTVTALGLPDITISWMSDLQLLVARLMGRLASRTLALKSPHGETVLQNHYQTKVCDLKWVIVWVCWAIESYNLSNLVNTWTDLAELGICLKYLIWIWEKKRSYLSILHPRW